MAGIIFLVLYKKKNPGSSRKLILLGLVFALILISRITVNLFGIWEEKEALEPLNGAERFLSAFIDSLQSFSLDADYSLYTVKGKELFEAVYGRFFADIYGIIASLLNILAPVMSGAVLLDILTGVFPWLKLSLHPWRRKFVFSHLNEASLTLAEDLIRDRNYSKIIYWDESLKDLSSPRPQIIFTDVYPDNESEAQSELLARARSLGAICLKSDLELLDLHRSASVYYFLIDEDENTNVSSLSGLLKEPDMWPGGKEKEEFRTRIFIFCQSELSVTMINAICKNSPNNDSVLVRPIRDYVNMAVSLMYDVPLFTSQANAGGSRKLFDTLPKPQTDDKGRIGSVPPVSELHVALIGSGTIAEEVFKAMYWCGQISGVQLFIHVLSRTAEEMKARIQASCPELFPSCTEHDEILRIYPGTDSPLYNPPYAILNSFRNINAEDPEQYPKDILQKTDYYVIALGSDEKNIYAAEILKKELSRTALETGTDRHPVIVPSVFSDRLADSCAKRTPGKYEPYIIPFGTFRKRFSCRNTFLTDFTKEALRSELMYNNKTHQSRQKDEYSYWANTVRAVHAPYKLYGLGCIAGVDLSDEHSDHRYVMNNIVFYSRRILSEWMEHRRWDAYLRSQGFCKATDQQHKSYYAVTHAHKDIAAKLHNCLVESSMRGNDLSKVNDPDMKGKYDALDMVSVRAYTMDHGTKTDPAELQDSEYKKWDMLVNDTAAQKLWSDAFPSCCDRMNACCKLGDTCKNEGRLSEAKDWYVKALKVSEEWKKNQDSDTAKKGYAYVNYILGTFSAIPAETRLMYLQECREYDPSCRNLEEEIRKLEASLKK